MFKRSKKSSRPKRPVPALPTRRFSSTNEPAQATFRLNDPKRRETREHLLRKLQDYQIELDSFEAQLAHHEQQNTKKSSQYDNKAIIQRLHDALKVVTANIQDTAVDFFGKQPDSQNPREILEQLFKQLSLEKERSINASKIPGYQLVRMAVTNLTPQNKQKIAKGILALSQVRSAEEAVVEEKKQELLTLLDTVFEHFKSDILSTKNNIIVRLGSTLSKFSFVLRIILFSKEDMMTFSTPMHARIKLLEKKRNSRSNAEIFNTLTEQFYCSDVPIDKNYCDSDSSDGKSENDSLFNYIGDDIPFIEIVEYIPNKNLAEEYNELHHDNSVDNDDIIKKAFDDVSKLTNIFKKFLDIGIGYTDIKPQNILCQFKISDVKSLCVLPEEQDTKICLPAAEFTPAYTDGRVNKNDYEAELALKIGMIATLYQLLTNNVPESNVTAEAKIQMLHFDWDAPILQKNLHSSVRIADFLKNHYESDEKSIKNFIAELAMYNAHLNLPVPQSDANDDDAETTFSFS